MTTDTIYRLYDPKTKKYIKKLAIGYHGPEITYGSSISVFSESGIQSIFKKLIQIKFYKEENEKMLTTVE